MEKINVKVRETARQALSSGEVDKILGFAKGDFGKILIRFSLQMKMR